MDDGQKAFVERLFREALQILALKASEQIRVTEPGYVPEEIIENYLSFSESYINEFENELSPEMINEINILYSAVETIPESAYSDSNEETLEKSEWQTIRNYAKRLLSLLQWPLEAPAPYESIGEGIFQRK